MSEVDPLSLSLSMGTILRQGIGRDSQPLSCTVLLFGITNYLLSNQTF
jgi:hypothetical protein